MTPAADRPMVSVVIPVCNEVDSVPVLHGHLASVAGTAPQRRWEFIFVDDGSRDGTWDALKALRAKDARVRPIKLKRNFGQTAAMHCGINAAAGEIIVTMDGDLQNDPADIPRLLAKLEEGYDVVCGWRHQRQDKLWTRRVPSLVANRLIGTLTGVRLHDYGCSLKAYRAAAIKRTPLYAEFHRFIPAMSTLTGAGIAELKVNHHARRFGRTKYNLSRTWRVALDMFTVSLLIKFSSRPLHLFGMLALSSAMVAVIGTQQAWQWYAADVARMPMVLPGVVVLAIWLAGHLVAVGLMAELCLATTHVRPDRLIAAVGEGAS